MDHAAAHERIADLALEPGRPGTLATSADPVDRELLDHATGCPDCRTELAAWDGTRAAVAAALAGDGPVDAELVPIRAPESLRDRVLGAARTSETPRAPDAPPRATAVRRPGSAALGLAAAIVVLVGGATVLVQQARHLDALGSEAQELQRVVAAVDRVLADPAHQIVELRQPDGTGAGSISWSRHDLVVLTTALAPPGDDQLYRCWLSENGQGWAVGQMYFADGTGYWAGSVDEWATFEIGPNTWFRVSLEPRDADPTKRAGPIVLQADLGRYASRNQ